MTSREQLIELVAQCITDQVAANIKKNAAHGPSAGLQETARLAAYRIVEDLATRDLLIIGPPAAWTVTIDDPQATRAYTYKVEAATRRIAKLKAARLAVQEDPTACMGAAGRDLTLPQRLDLAESPDLLEAVAAYGTVTEAET